VWGVWGVGFCGGRVGGIPFYQKGYKVIKVVKEEGVGENPSLKALGERRGCTVASRGEGFLGAWKNKAEKGG